MVSSSRRKKKTKSTEDTRGQDNGRMKFVKDPSVCLSNTARGKRMIKAQGTRRMSNTESGTDNNQQGIRGKHLRGIEGAKFHGKSRYTVDI